MFTLNCILVFLIAFQILIIKAESKLTKPTKLSSCKAQLDDGSIVDLTSLDNAGSPRTYPDGFYTYYFNPCSPIACKPGAQASAAICQKGNDPTNIYNLGDQSTATFDYDGSSLLLQFKSGTRSSVITCKCGTSEAFDYIDEQPLNNYEFTFTSKCCCPGGCGDGPTPTKKPGGGGGGGLSGGSILLIIFFSVLTVYFVGGFIFLKFVKKQNGLEAVPQSSFWLAVPGNVKAGFSFVLSKVRGNSSYQNI